MQKADMQVHTSVSLIINKKAGNHLSTDNSRPDSKTDVNAHKRQIIIGAAIVAVLFVAAIAAVNHRKNVDAAAESIAASEAAAAAAAQSDSAETEQEAFAVNEDEAINSAVKAYFDARLNADTTKIFELFGRQDTSADSDMTDRLKAQASWIQGFQDINVYSIPGISDNEVFCIVTYDIDFRRTDAIAPGVLYCFASKDAEGNVTFTETLMKDKVDFADKALALPSAKELIDDVNSRLKEVLAGDGTLALIYTSFNDGEIYKESEIDINAEQEVNVDFGAEDSVLVGDDVLKDIADEAAQAASIEASEGALDVYETGAAEDDSEASETETSAETEVQ